MAGCVTIRVLFGGEDDERKLTIKSGIPTTVEELVLEITTFFGVTEQFRLQYKDEHFNNQFMNLSSTSEIQDKSTVKVVYLTCETTCSEILASTPKHTCSTIPGTTLLASASSSPELSDSSVCPVI